MVLCREAWQKLKVLVLADNELMFVSTVFVSQVFRRRFLDLDLVMVTGVMKQVLPERVGAFLDKRKHHLVVCVCVCMCVCACVCVCVCVRVCVCV